MRNDENEAIQHCTSASILYVRSGQHKRWHLCRRRPYEKFLSRNKQYDVDPMIQVEFNSSWVIGLGLGLIHVKTLVLAANSSGD